jgi:hypothetical protein
MYPGRGAKEKRHAKMQQRKDGLILTFFNLVDA